MLVVIMLVLISFGSAFSFDSEFSDNIYVRELNNTINFSLDLHNITPANYNVFTYSDFIIQPKNLIYLENDTKLNFSIFSYNVPYSGRNSFSYTVTQVRGESIDKQKVITIMNFDDMVKVETNNIAFEDGIVKIYVENLEDFKFDKLTAHFSSLLFNVNKTFSLKEKETKIFTVDVSEDLLKTTKAGTYVMDVKFVFENGNSVNVKGKLYLDAKTNVNTTETKSGFLLRKNTITKMNTGNTVEMVNIRVKKNAITRLFTKFNIEPVSSYREGFNVYYSWDYRLNPNETYEVIAKTNYYLPILIIGLCAFLVYAVIRYIKIKVDIRKKITPIRTKNGEFALRVTLNIKARATVAKVILVDTVPSTVKLYRQFSSVEPNEINVETRKMKWIIGDLNAGEERAYSYVVYSRVGYVGRFSLPRAVVRFNLDGTDQKQYSKEIFFLAEQSDVEFKKIQKN